MEKQELTTKQKIILIILFICVMIGMWCYTSAEKEYNYLNASTAVGTICSDTYIGRETVPLSKNIKYRYKIRYTINGKEYVSNDFKSTNYKLVMGDAATVYYKKSEPNKVIEVQAPIFGFTVLVAVIIGIVIGVRSCLTEE